MKLLKQGLALVVMGAGLAVAPVLPVQAQPAAAGDGPQAMKREADGTTVVSKESATGRIGFIRLKGEGDLLPGRAGGTKVSATKKAEAYLDKYAHNFGARPGELKRSEVTRSGAGWTVTYTQEYKGLPVFGSMLRAQVDEQGDLTSVNGYAAPNLSLSTDPAMGATAAAKRAVATVRQDPPGHDGSVSTAGIKAATTDLVVYRMGATKGETGKAILAYQVEVTNEKNVRDMVFLHADTGKLVNRWSMVHDGLHRELYEGSGTPQNPTYTKVWEEGQPTTGLNEDQLNEINGTADSYWFFENAFGRDSWDGEGGKMITVNNDPTISCPNANWNGRTTNYCNGVSSDDVVAHEWGHAYTEATHGLIYQWQSGALNEAYSDIWGETIDLINGAQDEGESDARRQDGLCSAYTRGSIGMVINSPANVAGPCTAEAASFGPVFTKAGITTDVVVGTDAANPEGPSTTDACTTITNAAAVAGKFLYADRGTCTFAAKTANAEAAGATGIVVGDNVAGRAPISMSGDADIYGLMVTLEDGARIKSAGTVNATIRDVDTAAKTDSHRWLMGEKSTAFGGAIRDMWSPTCYGDPGKVSDAEYHCDTSDAGGVHSNSGVPNHAYALLVDGGTYNGQTVTGIGFDKAAAIYYRAMIAYQTPTTDFNDHADALASSCTDLVGQPINKVTTSPDAAPEPAVPVSAGDCAEVAKAVAAVELRKDPVQCNFKPLLDPNTPSLCGEGFEENEVWSEDFEDGLAGWDTSQEIVYEGGFGAPWQADSTAPGGRAGTVAYGPAPDRGQCVEGAGDFSSRDSIISPMIQMPGAEQKFPRLSFDHYVATEAGYDGGNVKISVNKGAFTVIPAAAYVFNAPGKLTGTATNTNPLAGEDGFSGTDGGELFGTWGTSQVDLAAAGAAPGDYVQFRFDIGRDGCGGLDGWYVDDISVSTCKAAVEVKATHVPEPSVEGQASRIDVKVERDGTEGAAPTGEVVVRNKAGDKLGEATLDNGSASIPLPADLPAGTHVLKVTYLGNASFASASTNVTVTVRPAGRVDSDTRAKVVPKKPRFRQDFTVKVRVKADEGITPTGRVAIRIDGKRAGVGTLDDGKVRIRVKRNYSIGKHKLVARYRGSDTVEGSRDKVTFKIRRR